jgi:hypothetical protein
LVSDIKGRTKTDGVSEQGAEENICTKEGWNDRRNWTELRRRRLQASYRLCGLVVRVSGYRSRGPGFDSGPYQIFWDVGGQERGPLSLVRTIEELLAWKSSGSGLENRD